MEHRLYTKVLHLMLCIALVLSFIPMMGTAANAENNHITEIASEADWNEFGNAVNGGYNYKDQKVVLLDDITVTEMMIGTEGAKFSGTFEGNGHTITVDYTVDEEHVAPFRFVDGAGFYDLKVSGNINTSKQFAGGFIARSAGNTVIDCCYSHVNINSRMGDSGEYDGTHGGFIAHLEGKGKVTIKDSLFDGVISGSTTANCGGFVGWPVHGSVEFRNCLNNGTFETSTHGCGTFSRIVPKYEGNVTIYNCYYKTPYGEVQGNPIGDMTPDQLREVLKDRETGKNFWIVSGGKVVPFSFKASATVTKVPVPAAKKMTANGKTQKLVKNGKAVGGTMMYALGNDKYTAPADGWSRLIPTGKKAGTYYVWYKVKANEFHLDTEPECVIVKLNKSARKIGCVTKSLLKKKDKKASIKDKEAVEETEEQKAENPGTTDTRPDSGKAGLFREQISNVRDTLTNIIKGIFRK